MGEDNEKELEIFKKIDWKAAAQLAGCYTSTFDYYLIDWDSFFGRKKMPGFTSVKAADIDWSKIYTPYVPLQISSVLLTEPDLQNTFSVQESDDRFPHRCPSCGGPAYIGLLKTECREGCQ